MDSKYKTAKVFTDFMSKHDHFAIFLFIHLLLPLIYYVVFITGGVRFVYAHTMYIPILLSGIIFGPKIGIITALIAGLLLGPLMPQNTSVDPYIYQPILNWLYRMIIFLIVGAISGYGSYILRNTTKRVLDLQSHNQDTQIPNRNYLRQSKNLVLNHNYSIISIHINNHDNIIDVLGNQIYYQLIYQLYSDLKDVFGKDAIIVQPDSNKLWLAIPSSTINCDCDQSICIG